LSKGPPGKSDRKVSFWKRFKRREGRQKGMTKIGEKKKKKKHIKIKKKKTKEKKKNSTAKTPDRRQKSLLGQTGGKGVLGP